MIAELELFRLELVEARSADAKEVAWLQDQIRFMQVRLQCQRGGSAGAAWCSAVATGWQARETRWQAREEGNERRLSRSLHACHACG